jgi:hypothetical protein
MFTAVKRARCDASLRRAGKVWIIEEPGWNLGRTCTPILPLLKPIHRQAPSPTLLQSLMATIDRCRVFWQKRHVSSPSNSCCLTSQACSDQSSVTESNNPTLELLPMCIALDAETPHGNQRAAGKTRLQAHMQACVECIYWCHWSGLWHIRCVTGTGQWRPKHCDAGLFEPAPQNTSSPLWMWSLMFVY